MRVECFTAWTQNVAKSKIVTKITNQILLPSKAVLAKRSWIQDLVLLRTKLLKWSIFWSFFLHKSPFFPLKSFWPQVLKTKFHFHKHCKGATQLCQAGPGPLLHVVLYGYIIWCSARRVVNCDIEWTESKGRRKRKIRWPNKCMWCSDPLICEMPLKIGNQQASNDNETPWWVL